MSLLDYLEEGWDYLSEGFSYFISFEWIGDVVEFFSSMFENIGDFSITGLILGILVCGLIYFLSPYMLDVFTDKMDTLSGIFWKLMTYVVSAVAGYLVGKRMENTN